MMPAPLLLLFYSVLLSSHLRPSAGRPFILPSWMNGSGRLQTQQVDDALLGAAAAGDGTATSGLLSDSSILRLFLRGDPEALRLLTAEEDGEEASLRTTAQLLKRSEGPPLSIDLTFHLLRNMIQMARTESQRKQTQLNRKLLDEVGK